MRNRRTRRGLGGAGRATRQATRRGAAVRSVAGAERRFRGAMRRALGGVQAGRKGSRFRCCRGSLRRSRCEARSTKGRGQATNTSTRPRQAEGARGSAACWQRWRSTPARTRARSVSSLKGTTPIRRYRGRKGRYGSKTRGRSARKLKDPRRPIAGSPRSRSTRRIRRTWRAFARS